MSGEEPKIFLENIVGGGISRTTPAAVQELLSSPGTDLSNVTVGIDCEKNSGWIWLVYARSVYTWNFKDQGLKCYELPLPSSELIYCARLCCVYPLAENDVTSPPLCLSVSPEGCVRYWPKINQPAVYIDNNVDLCGQVGHSIAMLKGKQTSPAAVLATTTCSLFLISVPGDKWQREQVIHCTPLKAPQTLFSGISRRVSSFIFATGASQDALVNFAAVNKKRSNHVNLAYVLNTKCNLQCWQLESGTGNQLLWETDVRPVVVDQVATKILNISATDVRAHGNIKLWPLDFIATARSRFALLVAVADLSLSRNVHYAVVFLNEADEPPIEFQCIFQLPLVQTYELQMEDIDSNDLRLLCPFSYDGVFVHDESTVAVSIESDQKVLNFSLPQSDHIVGAGVYGDQYLAFTVEKGLQTVEISLGRHTLPPMNDAEGRHLQLHPLTNTEEELEEMSQEDDQFTRFKAAFGYFMKQELQECEGIVENLFRGDENNLDDLVIEMATDILDDYPASDPRWRSVYGQKSESKGMTTRRKTKSQKMETESLLLLCQLDGKRKKMERFLAFLRSTKLKQELRTHRAADEVSVPTILSLCSLGERLEACTAFARLAEEFSEVLDVPLRSIMIQVLEEREETTIGALGVKDVFYRKVSLFNDLLPVLIDEGLTFVEQSLAEDIDEPDYAQKLFGLIGELTMVILRAATEYRYNFERLMHWQMPTEMTTWLNVETTRVALEKYYHQMVESLPSIGKNLLAKQCCNMVDSILAECSIARDGRLFLADLRRRLIMPLAQHGRQDDARALAEKYGDFRLLIELCCEFEGEALLEAYKTKHNEAGFLEHLYDYYISKGRAGKIVDDPNLESDVELATQTERYLTSRNRLDLRWIFSSKVNEFEKASIDLLTLASLERESIDKKKTLLSLAKLAALASDDAENDFCLKKSDEGLLVAEHQKRLSSVAIGPPLDAEKLIETYISDPDADQWYFGRAVDLLTSICILNMPQEEFNALRTRVWARAILRDNWSTILETKGDLLGAASKTIFSRTISFICDLNKEHREGLMHQFASADELLQSEELQAYAGNPKFQFVLRAGEEKVHSWLKGDQRPMQNANEDDDVTMTD